MIHLLFPEVLERLEDKSLPEMNAKEVAEWLALETGLNIIQVCAVFHFEIFAYLGVEFYETVEKPYSLAQ